MVSLRITLGIVLLALATSVSAQSTIEELVSQSGLQEGSIAVRDMPGWDASRKVLVGDVGLPIAELKSRYGETAIIAVASLEEALPYAASAGAILGYCDDELLAAATALTWVQIFSAGAERCIDSPRIASGEVLLTNMQKMSAPTIAEHAIAMLLSLTRNIPEYARNMDDGRWARGRDTTAGMSTIAGKTMLVIGLGGIGTEVAQRAHALGMRVIATRNSGREGPDFVDYVGLSDELLVLAGQAQVFVNALPLTDATRGLLDAEFFAAVEPGAILINVGRGATVDTNALLAALQSERLAGAGLDVTDPEPLPADHPLWKRRNVIITPHVSSRGGDRARQTMLMKENLERYFAGDALLNVVDPSKGY